MLLFFLSGNEFNLLAHILYHFNWPFFGSDATVIFAPLLKRVGIPNDVNGF